MSNDQEILAKRESNDPIEGAAQRKQAPIVEANGSRIQVAIPAPEEAIDERRGKSDGIDITRQVDSKARTLELRNEVISAIAPHMPDARVVARKERVERRYIDE
jgi:hypothetical protein